MIKDQEPDDVGRYAGWGTGEDLKAAAGKPQTWRAGTVPFPLRLRTDSRWWKVGIGLFWIPAIVVVITVENWLGFADWLIWTSLGLLYIGFMGYLLFWDQRRQDSIARR